MEPIHDSSSEIALAGEMTPKELEICNIVRRRLLAVLDRRVDFPTAIRTVWRALRGLGRQEFDLQAMLADLTDSQTAVDHGAGQATIPEPAPAQVEFVQDVTGMIDFAIRNGWGFPTVLSILGHDLSDLLHYDADPDKARADCWSPKSAGWAKRNTTTFGTPENEGD
jgi:hypothetical protein